MVMTMMMMIDMDVYGEQEGDQWEGEGMKES
jgi:hypothetical protein